MTEHSGQTPSQQPQSAQSPGRYGPPVHIGKLDVGPEELEWQLPIDGELYKLVPGPDRPDYSLIVLAKPLYFYPTETLNLENVAVELRTEDQKGRPMVRSDAVVVCARFVGEQLHPGMKDLPINIAFVIDNRALSADTLDFNTISYAAVGFLSEGAAPAAQPAAASAPQASSEPAPATSPAVASVPEATASDVSTREASAPASPATDNALENAPENTEDHAAASLAAAGAAAGAAAAVAAGSGSGSQQSAREQTDEPTRAPTDAPTDEAAAHAAGPAASEPEAGVDLGDPTYEVEVETVAADAPPPMVRQNEVLNGLALALRDGIEENRRTHVERLSATLTFDDQNRVTGLSGHADGTPPIPTPATFERLNEVAAGFADLPPHFRPSSVTMRLDGDHVNHEIAYE